MTESFAIAPAHLTWALAILIPAGVILVGAAICGADWCLRPRCAVLMRAPSA